MKYFRNKKILKNADLYFQLHLGAVSPLTPPYKTTLARFGSRYDPCTVIHTDAVVARQGLLTKRDRCLTIPIGYNEIHHWNFLVFFFLLVLNFGNFGTAMWLIKLVVFGMVCLFSADGVAAGKAKPPRPCHHWGFYFQDIIILYGSHPRAAAAAPANKFREMSSGFAPYTFKWTICKIHVNERARP